MINFIKYTGKYPNLCSGAFFININGQTVCFGGNYGNYNKTIDDIEYYDSFWYSGGSCGFCNNYSESYVKSGEWEFEDIKHFPKKYRKYYNEICEIFQDNVQEGCCGGCL